MRSTTTRTPGDLLDLMFMAWHDEGASAAPAIEALVATNREDHAAVLSRSALADPACVERARILAALDVIAAPPANWRAAIDAFAAAPSVEAWRELIRFTPGERVYHRVRNTLQELIGRGVDGNVLFRCATDDGTTPDAIELVERGLVDTEVVVQRGREGPARARGIWLCLAARAAFEHGDRLGVVRLLRDAFRDAHADVPLDMFAAQIRDVADDELNAMLDHVGVPRRR